MRCNASNSFLTGKMRHQIIKEYPEQTVHRPSRLQSGCILRPFRINLLAMGCGKLQRQAHPASAIECRSSRSVTVAPVYAGQRHDLSCQRIFVRSVDPLVALRSSPLPQQPAGMPLRYPVTLECMDDRATPRSGPRSFPPRRPSEFASPKTTLPPDASA